MESFYLKDQQAKRWFQILKKSGSTHLPDYQTGQKQGLQSYQHHGRRGGSYGGGSIVLVDHNLLHLDLIDVESESACGGAAGAAAGPGPKSSNSVFNFASQDK